MPTFDERAAARAHWPVTPADAEAVDAPLDGAAGWDAVLELTWEAWSLAGKMPDPLPRAEWPTRLFRKGEERPDSHGL